MSTMLPLLAFLILINAKCSQIYESTLPFSQLQYNNGWVYVTKFDFLPQVAKLQIELEAKTTAKQTGVKNLIVQGIAGREWQEEQQMKCSGVLRMPVFMLEMKMSGEKNMGMFQFGIDREETYYFVIEDCHRSLKEYYHLPNAYIHVRMKVLSNSISPAQIQNKQQIIGEL